MTDPMEQIWSMFGKQLSDLICHKTGHEDHCHDILQEVYLKMVKNIDKITKADNILPYIVTLTNNTVTDYYRANQDRKVRCETPTHLAVADHPTDDPTSRLAQSFMLELIETLPPMYKHALIRSEFEGVPQKQLADELGISYSGAKSRVQRAKEMLRQAILNCCDYKFDKYGNVISCCGS